MSSWISSCFCILVYSIEISDAYSDVRPKQWNAVTFLNICILVAHLLVLFFFLPRTVGCIWVSSIWFLFLLDAYWDSTALDSDTCAILFNRNCGICVKNKCYQVLPSACVCVWSAVKYSKRLNFYFSKEWAQKTPTHEELSPWLRVNHQAALTLKASIFLSFFFFGRVNHMKKTQYEISDYIELTALWCQCRPIQLIIWEG